MKNRMKKGLALLLGAAMTTGLLAGCGSEGGSENSAASGSEGGNASAEAGGSASDAGGGRYLRTCRPEDVSDRGTHPGF